MYLCSIVINIFYMDNIIFKDPNEKDFLLFRLQLLIGAQLEDLQKHPESVKNSRPIRDTYIEVMRVISLLQNNSNIKLTSYNGTFWTKEELDKKFHRNEF